MESIEQNNNFDSHPAKLTEEEFLWCQELATTLDPFSPENITPRQNKILQHFDWLSLVGSQGYELTQLILQKLHDKAQDDLSHKS